MDAIHHGRYTLCKEIMKLCIELTTSVFNAINTAQGVDLAYLQTGISGVFLGFEFQESVFFLGMVTAAVFFWVVK